MINRYWDGYVEGCGITRIEDTASFVDAHLIEVDGSLYSADHIVVATGGRPIFPSVPSADLGITSDGFFELAEQPRPVAIIGAGYIGVELAGVLRDLGSEVSIVALEARVLETFDPMISEVLMQEQRKQGIDLHMRFKVAGLAKTKQGNEVEWREAGWGREDSADAPWRVGGSRSAARTTATSATTPHGWGWW